MLLMHIGTLQQNAPSIQRLPAEVIDWYQRARKMEREQTGGRKTFHAYSVKQMTKKRNADR